MSGRLSKQHAHSHALAHLLSPTLSHTPSRTFPRARTLTLSRCHSHSCAHSLTPAPARTLARSASPGRLSRDAIEFAGTQASKSSARESQLTLLSPAGLHPPPPPSPHALSPSRPPFHSPTRRPASLLALTRSCDCYTRALSPLSLTLCLARTRALAPTPTPIHLRPHGPPSRAQRDPITSPSRPHHDQSCPHRDPILPTSTLMLGEHSI